MRRHLKIVVLVMAASVAAIYPGRPSRAPVRVQLTQAQSHEYRRLWVDGAVVHIVTIDLAHAAASVSAPADGRFSAWPVREHAVLAGADIAINANFFYPFHSHAPWDFAPRAGDVATPIGGVLAEGQWLVPADSEWPMVCISEDRARIASACADESWGVAGRPRLVQQGRALPQDGDGRQPRTAVATRDSGRRLLLVVVDGRQPLYSDGMSLAALADFLVSVGADDALNLDGGGSSTLVLRGQVLNAPIHTRLPMRQRPVPVHLGFRFETAAPR